MHSAECAELMRLKSRVKNDKEMRRYISAQQDTADNADSDLAQVWFKKMKKIMNQIDDRVKYVVPFAKEGRQYRFLDLGCCPGGFSTYVLAKNKLSTGVGVSLDPAEGGHDYLIDDSLRERHTIIFSDITRFELAPLPSPISATLNPLPVQLTRREYDLILLDGHQLRNQDDAGALLVVAQIIITLMTTKPAGSTVVMKLTNAETNETGRLLFLLDMLSSPDSLIAYKPYAMHREKATFYAIARGVGGGRERQGYLNYYLAHFLALWADLKMRGDIGHLKGRLRPGDLDFIASLKDLEEYEARKQMLCKEVFVVQKNALQARFDSFAGSM